MFRAPLLRTRCLYQILRQASPRHHRFQSSQPRTVYPALLARARQIALELEEIDIRLSEEYNVGDAKKVGELTPVAIALKRWEEANESLSELQALIRDTSTDSELRELASEDLESTELQLNEASQSLTKSLVPKHPFEHLPCLLEIRPGAGGGEATLFAADLLEMYQGYCRENGLRTTTVELVKEEDGGISEAIIAVQTPGAYGLLRCEAGVHRVQRVPATEKQGRVHTSSAAVMVLPSFPAHANDNDEINVDDPNSDYYVDPKDVKQDVMRSGGAGGQHVNKTESAVRLTHIPTNTVVRSESSRSQVQNRETAWGLLRSRIAMARREAREEEMVKMRRSVVGVAKIGRGDKIRTYNWQQQRITDHRSGMSVHGIEGFMDGGVNLEKLMVSVREWLVEREVEDMIASTENG